MFIQCCCSPGKLISWATSVNTFNYFQQESVGEIKLETLIIKPFFSKLTNFYVLRNKAIHHNKMVK